MADNGEKKAIAAVSLSKKLFKTINSDNQQDVAAIE